MRDQPRQLEGKRPPDAECCSYLLDHGWYRVGGYWQCTVPPLDRYICITLPAAYRIQRAHQEHVMVEKMRSRTPAA